MKRQQIGKHPDKVPKMLFSDSNGNIFDHPTLEVCGRSGNTIVPLNADDFIELPVGSELFFLKGRSPFGFEKNQNKIVLFDGGDAVAAFVAPAYTQLSLAASEKRPEAPILPLYAYSAVGWHRNRMYAAAMRVDSDVRQDCNQFDQKIVNKNYKLLKKKFEGNRLFEHIGHCATVYMCPAARNFFHFRWEAPLPASPSCNSRCIGCISYQPAASGIISPQNRIGFIPSPQEIADIALFHISHAPNPIVSFGQGCEGEPLNVWETLREAIILIRKSTDKGIINLNSNGSKPEAVEELCKVGLDSIRISLNSAQRDYYNLYYQPVGYEFDNLWHSATIARSLGKWVSLNYFVFPGISDQQTEIDALTNLIEKNKINMIQWRNFNIDPELYTALISKSFEKAIGVKRMINDLHARFPRLYRGYFNPGAEIIKSFIK